MSKLSRVVKFIFAIWILAFTLATPQALQYGLVHITPKGAICTVIISNINTFLSFENVSLIHEILKIFQKNR
jgi:hypothetical protein